jgi:hypothetical protein
MAAIRSNGPELVAFSASEDFKLVAGPAAQLGSWRIFFSGRTQRDAIVGDSELRWFASKEAE